MHRRDFLKAAAAATIGIRAAGADNPEMDETKIAKEYLFSIMPSKEMAKNFIAGPQEPEGLSKDEGFMYDPQLGWVHCAAIRNHGVNNTKAFYNYEPDGARVIVNCRGKTSRIHVYGNSFTQCIQVNDGETWPEYLAAGFQEPIRNYGVGAYGVYQAYLRMLKVETKNPADYIILNIWEDDHYRSLDAWRPIRFGKVLPYGFTQPYLRVDAQANICRKFENPLKEPKDVYKLCDKDYVWQTYKDDPILKSVLSIYREGDVSRALDKPASVSVGIPVDERVKRDIAEKVTEIHTKQALYASENILEWTEEFVKKTGRHFILMLSYSRRSMASELAGKPRFDQSFMEWLKGKSYPVIDTRDAFTADYKNSKLDIDAYLDPFYVGKTGHHTPLGNYFTSLFLISRLTKILDPLPLPYR
jgi:hypothetical protein